MLYFREFSDIGKDMGGEEGQCNEKGCTEEPHLY
jgi:hypothetical protein